MQYTFNVHTNTIEYTIPYHGKIKFANGNRDDFTHQLNLDLESLQDKVRKLETVVTELLEDKKELQQQMLELKYPDKGTLLEKYGDVCLGELTCIELDYIIKLLNDSLANSSAWQMSIQISCKDYYHVVNNDTKCKRKIAITPFMTIKKLLYLIHRGVQELI